MKQEVMREMQLKKEMVGLLRGKGLEDETKNKVWQDKLTEVEEELTKIQKEYKAGLYGVRYTKEQLDRLNKELDMKLESLLTKEERNELFRQVFIEFRSSGLS